jgi:hypothetical protein
MRGKCRLVSGNRRANTRDLPVLGRGADIQGAELIATAWGAQPVAPEMTSGAGEMAIVKSAIKAKDAGKPKF